MLLCYVAICLILLSRIIKGSIMFFKREDKEKASKLLETKVRRLEKKLSQQNEQILELRRRLLDAGRHLKRMQSHAVS